MAETLDEDLDTGLKSMKKAFPRYEKAEEYYKGDFEEKFITPELERMLTGSDNEFMINLSRRVVTAVNDRMEIAAVTANPDPADNTSDAATARQEGSFDVELTKILNQRVWHANQLDIEAPQATLKALIYGDAYLFVWPTEDGDGVDIFYNSPLTTRVFYDEERPREKSFALKKWKSKHQGEDRVRLNVYYPDVIYKLVSKRHCRGEVPSEFEPFVDTETDENGAVENPFGEIPIFHFRTAIPYGEPEHEQGYGPQDAINKLVSAQMVSTDFAAFPQRWAVSRTNTDTDTDIDWGGDDDQTPEEKQSQLTAGPGRVWLMDNIDKVGQFPAADTDQFLKPIDKFIELMASVTATPLSYLHKVRGTSSTPLSGKSQRQTEVILLKKVEARQRFFSATWREALQFAMKILGYDDIVVAVNWDTSRVENDKETWEATLLQQQSGVPMRQTLLETGYTETEVTRWGYTEAQPNGPEIDTSTEGGSDDGGTQRSGEAPPG